MKFSTSLVRFGNVGELALELKKALTAIAAGWNVDHLPDGTHKIPLPPPGDSGDVLTSVGGEWSSEAPPSSAGIHATTHSSGGTDPVTVTNLAGYPGGTTNFLRADGTFAPAGSGGAHATTHQPGGSDPMAVDAVAATGSLRTLGTGAQQAASGTDARLTNARTPTAHATTHQPGGSDAMAVDAAAATGSLRTLGTTSTSAAAGNDARFTDARTPTAHAPTHKSGGTDAIKLDELAAPTDVTTLNASTTAHGLLRKLTNVTSTYLDGSGNWTTPSGTGGAGDVNGPAGSVNQNVVMFGGTTGKGILDSGIPSAQVARRDTANTFTQPNIFTNTQEFQQEAIFRSAAPVFSFVETDQGANLKNWQFFVNAQLFGLVASNDVWTALAQPLSCDRSGNVRVGAAVYERGRSVPIGEWTDVPFNAADFTGVGGTWTVTSAVYAYIQLGKTVIFSLTVPGTSTITGAPTALNVAYPAGLGSPVRSVGTSFHYVMAATTPGTGLCQMHTAFPTVLYITRDATATAFAAGTFYLYLQGHYSIA